MDVQTKTLLCVITAILVDVSGHTMIPVPRRGKNKLIFWWIIMKNRIPNSSRYWLRKSIVFIPVDPRSGFWILTGLSGSIFIFFKSKQYYFNKKTKINELQSGFWLGLAGSTESHRVFLPLFFLQPHPGFSSWSAGSRVNPPDRAGPSFKTMHKSKNNGDTWRNIFKYDCARLCIQI
jgi:hypothetical protein